MAPLLTLTGCQSKTIVLDDRPAWVVQAKQKLKQQPVSKVNRSVDQDSRPLWDRQPADDASEPKQSSTARKRWSSSPASTASPSPAAQPDGVSWGETTITVEVED